MDLHRELVDCYLKFRLKESSPDFLECELYLLIGDAVLKIADSRQCEIGAIFETPQMQSSKHKYFGLKDMDKRQDIIEKMGKIEVDYESEYLGVQLTYFDSTDTARIEEFPEKTMARHMSKINKKFEFMQKDSVKDFLYLFADIVKIHVEPFEKSDLPQMKYY